MDILVTGKIVQALQPQSGVSQRGNQWARQPYIIEHESGQYPKRLVFDVKDQRIQEFALQVGEIVTLHLNMDCHEYPQGSGKFFNNIEAWKVERAGQQMYQQGYQPQYAPQQMYQQVYQQMPQQAAPFPPQVNAQGQPVQAPFPPQQPAAQPQQGGLPFPPAQ